MSLLDDMQVDAMPGSHWMSQNELINFTRQQFPQGYLVIRAMKLTGKWYRPLILVTDTSSDRDALLSALRHRKGIQPIYDNKNDALCAGHTLYMLWLKEQNRA